SLIPPHPPPPPLFPYTTLFRSDQRLPDVSDPLHRHGNAAQVLGLAQKPPRGTHRCKYAASRERGGIPAAAPLRLDARRETILTQDRKSTRLNSSHVKISYAVFC